MVEVGQKMKFWCMYCGQKLAIRTIYAGLRVPCPACGKEIMAPHPNDLAVSQQARGEEDAPGEQKTRILKKPKKPKSVQGRDKKDPDRKDLDDGYRIDFMTIEPDKDGTL